MSHGIAILAYFVVGAIFADVVLDDWRDQRSSVWIPIFILFMAIWPLLVSAKLLYKIFRLV